MDHVSIDIDDETVPFSKYKQHKLQTTQYTKKLQTTQYTEHCTHTSACTQDMAIVEEIVFPGAQTVQTIKYTCC